jgi:pimeloyl-ACP methyl ester carboxylesterase
MFKRGLIVFSFIVFALAAPLPTALAAEGTEVGVVLLHGKTGNPAFMMREIGDRLLAAGFLVEAPELPWSRSRYLDADYEQALREIGYAANWLSARGAARVVVVGHSLGANGALGYAAAGGKAAAVVVLAPGHNPDLKGWRDKFGAAVTRAKELVAAGRGDETASYPDTNMGKDYSITTKARIYVSYFAPEGPAAMPRSAALLPAGMPLLYVAGTGDPLTARGQEYIFAKAPANPYSRYVTVSAGHLETPAAAAGEVITWIKGLPK